MGSARPRPRRKVLVVDDNSRDGTGEIADRLADDVLHRPGKQGLGRAYTAGFARALEHGAAYVVEMDADLSHDPADLPRLIAPAIATAPTSCSARATSTAAGWRTGTCSAASSRSPAASTRAACSACRSATSPAASSASAPRTLRRIDARTASAQGYAFQVELTWRTLSLGLKIVEVPIRFRERRLGESKMSAQIALEAAWRVPALRYGPRRWRPLGVGRPTCRSIDT